MQHTNQEAVRAAVITALGGVAQLAKPPSLHPAQHMVLATLAVGPDVSDAELKAAAERFTAHTGWHLQFSRPAPPQKTPVNAAVAVPQVVPQSRDGSVRAGQQAMIAALLAKKQVSVTEFEARLGQPIAALNQAEARQWIRRLVGLPNPRKQAGESG